MLLQADDSNAQPSKRKAQNCVVMVNRAAPLCFRGARPVFDFGKPFLLGRTREDGRLDLYTSNGEGYVCMRATLDWQD